MARECDGCGEPESAAFPFTRVANREFCPECIEDLGYDDEPEIEVAEE